MLKQLIQWPPTSSTVIGLGLLIGALDYVLTGNTVQAVAVAGLFKVLCPQAGDAIDQVDAALGQIGRNAGMLFGPLALAGLLALAACNGAAPIVSLSQGPVGQAIVNALVNNIAPGVNEAIAKGEAAAKPELDMVAYALPWADKALDVLGPIAGLSAATIVKTRVDIALAEQVVAHPPASVAEAVAQAAAIYQSVVAQLGPALRS